MDRSAGIGISLAPNKVGQLVVTKIAPDGPAFQSKEICPGDILIQVNGTLLEGMTLEQVWSFIMGPPNTRVDLQLLRPNEQQDGDGGAEEIYVSIFRSSVSSPNITGASKFPKLFSPGQRDVSLPRSSRANSTEVQTVTPYSQMSPIRDQMGGERAWPSPQNNLTSGFRDVSPSQRPGPLLASADQRSRIRSREPEWSASPSQTSPPRYKTGSPSAIDSYGVLRDPRRISPRKVTPPKQQTRLGPFGTEVNYRRTQSAQDPRRSWSGNARQSFQENRFSTPQYVRPSRMRDASPIVQGSVQHGIGIVLYNDEKGDLRVLEISENGPADSQGCPFIPGDIVVAINGRYVRGLPSVQARSMILGRYGAPVEVTVFRQVQSLETNASKSMFSIPFTIMRGVVSTYREPRSEYKDSFQSPPASNMRDSQLQGYTTIPSAAISKEAKCGIGIFVEHILGCFVVKSINPMSPASKISTTNLSLGDYIVAIDGHSTQGLNINQVRVRIIGPHGSSVVLHLRRFMPNTGDFSHIFRTRIRRDFPLRSTTTVQRGSAVPMRTRDVNMSRHDISNSFADSHISHIHGQLDSNTLADSHADINVSNQTVYVSKNEGECGVGIELVGFDQVLMIRDVKIGGPANRSCLISKGDILHRIDYQTVAGLSVEEAMALLNGPAKSSVVLGIVKPKHRLRVNVRLQREQARSGSADKNIPVGTGRQVRRDDARPDRVTRDSNMQSQRADRGIPIPQLAQLRRAAASGQVARSTLQFSTPIRAAYNYARPALPLTPYMISSYHSTPFMEYRL